MVFSHLPPHPGSQHSPAHHIKPHQTPTNPPHPAKQLLTSPIHPITPSQPTTHLHTTPHPPHTTIPDN
ncbi:hypothetical protein E2C01_046882 [Portunus trituberculatus]|uniref:Uncharacterized protein n=1 Tax=Portunus trituberculatus TaxID=210409 RepID=A0A5B7G7B9_PORTR|nr:hypothetical protein [Portunus trituberculatus]